MRYAFLVLLCVSGVLPRVEAQPRVSVGGTASYLRLGGFGGIAFSAGGYAAFPIKRDQRSGWVVGAVWWEAAGVAVEGDDDRYFYNSFANICSDDVRGGNVNQVFCRGGAVGLQSRLFELLYAPATGGRWLLGFGGGLRHGEEVTQSRYDGTKRGLRPYGTALVEVPMSSSTAVLVQTRVGEGVLQMRGGLLFHLD